MSQSEFPPDLTDQLLNEPYILSPYKLCVANYLLCYIEIKNEFERNNIPLISSSRNDSLSKKMSPNIQNSLSHCQIGFQLMMSLDCSYAELRSRLMEAMNNKSNLSKDEVVLPKKFAQQILRQFDNNLIDIRLNGLNKLYDFIQRLQRVILKKSTLNNSNNDLGNMTSDHLDTYRIHRHSMAGQYIRKLMIHFERLVFSDVAILHSQLERYLYGETDYEDLNNHSVSQLSIKKTNQSSKKSGVKPKYFKSKEEKPLMTKLNLPTLASLNYLYKFLSKNEKEKNDPAYQMIMAELSKLIIECTNSSFSDEERHSLSSDSMMSLDSTEYTLDTNSTDIKKLDLQQSSSKLSKVKRTCQKKSIRKLLSRTNVTETDIDEYSQLYSKIASQHFLLKQVYKILINEHLALSPPEIVNFIDLYFEQNNRFHFNQFIQLNYKANLNMIRRSMAAIESNGNGTSSSGPPAATLGPVPPVNQFPNQRGDVADIIQLNIQTNPVQTGQNGHNGNLTPSVSSLSVGGSSSTTNNKVKDLFQSINYYSDIYYLKYINALRINDYLSARECFFAYFDLRKTPNISNDIKKGDKVLSGSVMNSCWSSLNLAIMYVHFRHYRLAYEALTDCISVARERRDESCLQFAMIWLLVILQHYPSFDNDESLNSSNQKMNDGTRFSANYKQQKMKRTLTNEFSHRHHQAYNDLNSIQNLLNLISINECGLPYIAAMAYLHLEKQVYLRPIYPSLLEHELKDESESIRPRRPPLSTKPLIFAVRNAMDDILMKALALHAAILNAYGAVHLGAITSNILASLRLVDMVDQDRVPHVNENQAIACRNYAWYQWSIRGNYQRAINLLTSFSRHYSSYNNQLLMIIEQTKSEICFEQFLYEGDWYNSMKCINKVRCINQTQALMMLARLRQCQNENISALECIDKILPASYQSSSSTSSSVFKVKSRIPFVGATLCSGTNGFHRQTYSSVDIAAKVGWFDGRIDSEDSIVTNIDSRIPKSLSKAIENPAKRTLHGSLNTTPTLGPSKSLLNNITAKSDTFNPLEPEDECRLVPESDPYILISCMVMRASLLGDLSELLECVIKCQTHGLRSLETRSLLEIARIQQTIYGEYVESQDVINQLWIRLLSNGSLRDLGLAYYLTAVNHFRLNQQNGYPETKILIDLPLRYRSVTNWKMLDLARWANQRSIIIWKRIGDKRSLVESLSLASFIEHSVGNSEQRNYYAKEAKLIRSQLLK